MSLKTKLLGGAAVFAIAGTLLATQNGLPGQSTHDTSERRKYTLIANTHMHRARVDVYMTSNLGQRVTFENKRVPTPWKTSFWAEPGEVLHISFTVRTYGDQRYRRAPWARCEIQRNGAMAGGDTEIDQLPIVERPEDVKKQAVAECGLAG